MRSMQAMSMGVRVYCVAAVLAVAGRSAMAATDVWTDASGDNLWNTTSVNWLQGGVPAAFTNGDGVVLNDSSGAGHYNVTLAGALQPAVVTVTNSAGNYVFSGAGTIGNFGVTPTGLVKLGSGNLTLDMSAASTYTGGTTVGEGMLSINFSALASHSNLISASSPLVLSGGTLNVTGAATGTSAQTFANTTLNSGASAVVVNNGGGAGTTVTIGAITRNIGSTVDFTIPTGGAVATSSGTSGGILGGYATVAGSGWATVTAGNIGALLAYTNDTWAAGNNTDVTVSSAPASGSTTNSLRFNAITGSTVTLSGANTIQSGGILVTTNASGQTNAITGGSLTSGNGLDLIVNGFAANGTLTAGSTVTNNGVTPIGLTVSGVSTFAASVTGANTYTGITTINNAILSANTLANGGTASSIGQSSNGAANLVINGGTLQYVGAGGATDRLLTLGPGGGTLDASGSGAISFSNTGAAAFSADAPATLTLAGSNTGTNTLAVQISDPDVAHTYATSVVKSGAGEWAVTNANTYTGGTILNGGVFKANNTTGSATGTGPVTVNATALLGGSGFVGGPVTVNAGGSLTPGDATNFTINSSLTLKPGALGGYAFNTPNIVGPGGGNDLTTVSSGLTINQNFNLNVTPGNSFGAGTYTVVHYGSVSDNSSGFTGWNANLQSLPASLSNATFTLGFQNDATNNNINLVVATSGNSPTLPSTTIINNSNVTNNTVVIIQPANQGLNHGAANNPAVNIKIPVNNQAFGGNAAAGAAAANFGFFIQRAPQPAAKAFAIGWVPVLAQIAPTTPYYNVTGIFPDTAGFENVSNPGWAYAGTIPTNPAGGAPGLPDTGIPVNGIPQNSLPGAGGLPILAYPGANPAGGGIPPAGDLWLPAFRLAPLIVFVDPPATPVPTYYAENYSNPMGLSNIHLVDETLGDEYLATSFDALANGADDQFNYQGSFLSLVQQDFPGITDLSQLTNAQWAMFDGSYGVDTATQIAWAVDDNPTANYTVVAIGNVPEPATVGLLGAGVAGLLARRRRAGGVRD